MLLLFDKLHLSLTSVFTAGMTFRVELMRAISMQTESGKRLQMHPRKMLQGSSEALDGYGNQLSVKIRVCQFIVFIFIGCSFNFNKN